jgi:cyclopropane-fatty-acyl-phospholipid synthase
MTTEATLETPLTRAEGRPLPFLGRQVLATLATVRHGRLVLREGGRVHELGDDTPGVPVAEVDVRDPRMWTATALRGSVGVGEAYARGWWTSPDPTAVVRLFVRNLETLDGMESGLARLSRPVLALYHRMRDNTERGSRDNISAHYDLSNEFFELFLDPTMTYSCGIFEGRTDTPTAVDTGELEAASIEKIDRLCRKLELRAGERLVEIGTGWGALSIHAAREYGVHVTTTTISERQHEMAARRIAEAGLEDRITLLFEDYRRLPAWRKEQGLPLFDKAVSVEMIEAVGHRFFDSFFRVCSDLLAPHGRMALQAITISDQHYEQAKRSVDFIQRHIFPGSCIPSVTALCSSMTAAGELRLQDLEDIGPHYVTTLATWRRNLLARWEDARGLGLDDTFLRLFEFYFAYCEGGFAERHISTVQMMLDKPGARPARDFRTAGR